MEPRIPGVVQGVEAQGAASDETAADGVESTVVWSSGPEAVILMGLSGLTDGKKGLGLTSHGMVKAVYHAWAALLGGEDSEWHDWPGRILRLGLLFIVLVVSATYTANLASFFTRPGIKLHGPKDRASLRDAVACVLPEESTVAIAQPFVKDPIHACPRFRRLGRSAAGCARSHRTGLRSGV
ncbi:unnamed protein product [Prorocentrum cordatum]|uniref:Ionotropic glutamate receptor C-terminal domain-containing protein n=1 Tax=Prorocentrum cordatum TaxID=2364126 RepID=A0ABN9PWD0_9DINO|nr:unnamed protein product [Polarella glacialis]